MRCSTAAVLALSAHHGFRDFPWLIEMTEQMVARRMRQLDATYVACLPPPNARRALEADLERILRLQRRDGRWKKSDALSYAILMSFKHAGMLGELIDRGRFRHDPFSSFARAQSYYGLAVRRNAMNARAPGDAELAKRLCEELLVNQQADGSWHQSVISTCQRLRLVKDLGLSSKERRVREGLQWLLGRCEAAVKRQGRQLDGVSVGHHMFSAENRDVEFKRALAELPEWNPVGACYHHLPMIQTGLALRTLIEWGLQDHDLVLAGCRNLVELRERFGGWCDTRIRTGLLAEGRAQSS